MMQKHTEVTTPSTPYAQTIDAAFKMLRLCGVTYSVVDGVIFAIGRDGLVYNTLAATTDYAVTYPDSYSPVEPAKKVKPTPALKPCAPASVKESNPAQKRAPDIISRQDIPVDTRLKFRYKRKPNKIGAVFEPYLINLKVGDVAQIPLAAFPAGLRPERARSTASSWASKFWGNQAHRSCITSTHVEILRTK